MLTTRSTQLRGLIEKDLVDSSAPVQEKLVLTVSELKKGLDESKALLEAKDFAGASALLESLGKRLEQCSAVFEKESGSDYTEVRRIAQDVCLASKRLSSQIKLGGPAEVKMVLEEISADFERALGLVVG